MSLAPFILCALLTTVFGRMGRGSAVWAFLQLPSTAMHELCHYFVALLLRSRPSSIDLVPRRADGGWTLGSVTFHPHWATASFVALAPALLFGGAWALVPAEALPMAQQVIRGMTFSWCLMGGLPSRTDWEIALKRPFGLAVGLTVAWLWLYK